MPAPEDAPRDLDDLLDRVLLDMAASHPEMPLEQETWLKAKLFELMADEEGWKSDPEEMAQRFSHVLTLGPAIAKAEASAQRMRTQAAAANSAIEREVATILMRHLERKAALLRDSDE